MKEITRRQFIKWLTGLSLGTLSGGALLSQLSCASREEPSPIPTSTPIPPSPSPYAHHEAMYYRQIGEGLVQCQLCPNRCTLPEGSRSPCRVRENREGRLYTMAYGNPCAVHNDPIEKKPFFHFLPGTLAFSIATAGCNLHCLYCQNWTISQKRPEETDNLDLLPEDVAKYALKEGSQSIAYTYSEPNIFYEYMLDTAKAARPKGLRNVVVSNGYINPDPLRELCHAVDAIRVDLKGFSEKFYNEVCSGFLAPVLESLKIIHEEGVHLEIVNLVVPTLNDDTGMLREMVRWIVDNVGPDVPTHFDRFVPMYKLTKLPLTPVETLERARAIAMEEGVNYAYIGNVPGHPAQSTYCAKCGKLLIKRTGYYVVENHVIEGKCEYCGNPIPGVWE